VYLLRVSRTLSCARWSKQTEEFEERGKEAEVGGISETAKWVTAKMHRPREGIFGNFFSVKPPFVTRSLSFPSRGLSSPDYRSSLFVTVAGRDDLRERIADVLIQPKNLTRSLEISLLAKASAPISRSASAHLNKKQRSSRGNVKREFKRIIGKLTGCARLFEN